MTRDNAVRRVGIVVLALNLFLLLGKGIVWIVTDGGLALGSEAVNSGIDTLYSIVVLIGLYYTTKAADSDHPHGHERIEPFVSLFIALGAFVLAIGLFVQGGRVLFFGATPTTPSLIGALVLIGTVIAKYAVYQYSYSTGVEYNSPAATAIALDNRNDILTAAVAVAGIVAAVLGAPLFDAVAALVVAVGIFYTGYEITVENVRYLIGAAPPDSLQESVVDAAMSVDEVRGVHDVVPHYVGPEVDVSLHAEVPSGMTLREAHEVETEIIREVEAVDDTIDDVYVHVDPEELDEWEE